MVMARIVCMLVPALLVLIILAGSMALVLVWLFIVGCCL